MESVLAFALLLGFMVLIHELGHFTVAKLAGIKVEEFGIGFPPRLLAFRLGETEYSLNAIPLGGFVRMLGEEDPTQPRILLTELGVGYRLVVPEGASQVAAAN